MKKHMGQSSGAYSVPGKLGVPPSWQVTNLDSEHCVLGICTEASCHRHDQISAQSPAPLPSPEHVAGSFW